MALENYRELTETGGGRGFQFEFHCSSCERKWKSDYQPFRLGQTAEVLGRLVQMFGGLSTAWHTTTGVAEMRQRKAHDAALAAAMEKAETLYKVCSSCRKEYCADCFDDREGLCLKCEGSANAASSRDASAGGAKTTAACPNCGTAGAGGRFCAECGFDMASTHKSCPSCGVMTLRQARYCTDCGHGF